MTGQLTNQWQNSRIDDRRGSMMDADRRTFLKILAGAGIATALGVPGSASADVAVSTRLP